MRLTFTRPDGRAVRVIAPNGLELFSITPTTSRGHEALIVHTDLPGLGPNSRINLPEGVSKYGADAEALAMTACVDLLTSWVTEVLGVKGFEVEYDRTPPQR